MFVLELFYVMLNAKDNHLETDKEPETIAEFLNGVRLMVTRLKNSKYHELELSTEKWNIRMAKDRSSENNSFDETAAPSGEADTEEPKDNQTKESAFTTLQEPAKVIPVTSQMVGIFSCSISRNSTSNKIISGDTVKLGGLLGGIEAVNIMHQVTAPANGRILEVLVEDGDPVEYGQFLFLLETDKETTDVQ